MIGQIRVPTIAGQTDYSLTLPAEVNSASAWEQNAQSGFYTQTVSLTGMTTTTAFFADVDLSSAQTAEAANEILSDWAKVDRVQGLQNQVKFYCGTAAPEGALPVRIRIFSANPDLSGT